MIDGGRVDFGNRTVGTTIVFNNNLVVPSFLERAKMIGIDALAPLAPLAVDQFQLLVYYHNMDRFLQLQNENNIGITQNVGTTFVVGTVAP
jgi:hypothetical protein